jgi:hypothetical protein
VTAVSFLTSFVSSVPLILLSCRQKVDLTKYVDSHTFVFDEVFSDDSTNEDVMQFPVLACLTRCVRC